jgi:hypothetical protein
LRQPTRLLVFALIVAGCASAAARDEEKARAARVRIVANPETVNGCQPLGSVTDDDIPDLQRKVLRMGGDIGLVTVQSQGSSGAFGSSGGGFRSRTYATVEVHRCEGTRPRP